MNLWWQEAATPRFPSLRCRKKWKRTSISVDLETAGEETRCDKAVENAGGLIGQRRREAVEHDKLFPALVTVDRGAGVRDERVVPRLLVKLQCRRRVAMSANTGGQVAHAR